MPVQPTISWSLSAPVRKTNIYKKIVLKPSGYPFSFPLLSPSMCQLLPSRQAHIVSQQKCAKHHSHGLPHKKSTGCLCTHVSSGEEYFPEARNKEEWDTPRAFFPKNISTSYSETEPLCIFTFSQKCSLLEVEKKSKTFRNLSFIGLKYLIISSLGFFILACLIISNIPLVHRIGYYIKWKFLINAHPASSAALLFLYNYTSQRKCFVLPFNFYYSGNREILITYSHFSYEIQALPFFHRQTLSFPGGENTF